MSTSLETTILERLHELDEQRQAEVLDFVQYLAAKSGSASSRQRSGKPVKAASKTMHTMKPGVWFSKLSQQAGLTDGDVAALEKSMERLRSKAPHEPLGLA